MTGFVLMFVVWVVVCSPFFLLAILTEMDYRETQKRLRKLR